MRDGPGAGATDKLPVVRTAAVEQRQGVGVGCGAKGAHAQSPQEIIKDPMYLEFLGLKPQATYYEKDLESAIITHLQHFLLELGQGFTFVARQKRILLEDDEFFADLVFYNRLLKCFVVVELKTGKLTHQDWDSCKCMSTTTTGWKRWPTRIPP